jgi:hypothetical protein
MRETLSLAISPWWYELWWSSRAFVMAWGSTDGNSSARSSCTLRLSKHEVSVCRQVVATSLVLMATEESRQGKINKRNVVACWVGWIIRAAEALSGGVVCLGR